MANYDYFLNLSQVRNTPLLPFHNVFNIVFHFSQFLQLSHRPNRPTIPCGRIKRTYSYGCDLLFSEEHGPRLVSTMLSSVGSPPEIIQSRVPQIISFAREMETTYITSGRVLTMVLDLSITTYIDRASIQMLMMQDVPRISLKPACRVAIEKLEKVRVQDSEKSMDCRVCMEEFEVDGEVRRMPCGHTYHEECIFKWLETSNICPLCRYKKLCQNTTCSCSS